MEPLQVVIYNKDQQYRPHHDYFREDSKEIVRGGNRTDTVLIYLNDLSEEDGGATSFPMINLKVKPKALNAIHFKDMVNGKVDERTLHAGELIKTDKVKYAVNVWFREREFN